MKCTCSECGTKYEYNGGRFDTRYCPNCGAVTRYVRKSYNIVYDEDGNEMPIACQYCSRDAYPFCKDNCLD